MRSILKIFGHSPFADFQSHMAKIKETIDALDPVFAALYAQDLATLRQAAKRVSQLEHEADDIKNHIRDHLPRTLFLPVDRRDMLEVLSAQDAICDCAEDIAVVLSFRLLSVPPFLQEHLEALLGATKLCFNDAVKIVERFDVLVEAGFRGPARTEVLELIKELTHREHLADKEQDKLLKDFYRHEDEFKPAEHNLWPKVFSRIGDLANYSERMANRVRLIIAS